LPFVLLFVVPLIASAFVVFFPSYSNILANLSENPERRRELAERGLLETMLPLLRSANEVILQGATKFFAQMCENQEYAEQAVENGLLDYLARYPTLKVY